MVQAAVHSAGRPSHRSKRTVCKGLVGRPAGLADLHLPISARPSDVATVFSGRMFPAGADQNQFVRREDEEMDHDDPGYERLAGLVESYSLLPEAMQRALAAQAEIMREHEARQAETVAPIAGSPLRFAFGQTYNEHWLIERHGHRSPAQLRRDQMDKLPLAA